MIGWSAILTWPVLIAQLVIFGTAAFALLAPPGTLPQSNTSSLHNLKLWRALALLNLVTSPLVFLEMASGMAQLTWAQTLPFLQEITSETLAGRIWIWRLRLILILTIALWIPMRARLMAMSTMVLGASLIALSSVTSHAVDRGTLAVAIYFVHQAAGGLWLGALISLLMSARNRADAVAVVTPRVSTVCAWSVAAITVSGFLTAFQSLGWNFHLLFDSSYGRTLTGKLVTAAPAVLLGGYNRYWQVPKVSQGSVGALLVRSVATECILLVAVLGWSAMLANTSPPH